jgi:hypothetical protein
VKLAESLEQAMKLAKICDLNTSTSCIRPRHFIRGVGVPSAHT